MSLTLHELSTLRANHRRLVLDRATPEGWRLLERRPDGEGWRVRIRGQVLHVIWSIGIELDGREWLHVSASHPSRIPLWEEMCRIKDVFVGPDRWAYQLHPPQDDYVNIHPGVLHMFAPPAGESSLPDFTRGTGSI